MIDLIGFGSLFTAAIGFFIMSVFDEWKGFAICNIGVAGLLGTFYFGYDSAAYIILSIGAFYILYVAVGMIVRTAIRNKKLIIWREDNMNVEIPLHVWFKMVFKVTSYNSDMHQKYLDHQMRSLRESTQPYPLAFVYFWPIFIFQIEWKTVRSSLSIKYKQLLKETEEWVYMP